MFRERELRMQQWLIEMIRIVVVKGIQESRESPAFYYSLPVCVLHSVRGTTPERPRPWESFCGFGTNCCRVKFRSLSRALLSTAAAEHTVTPQALLRRESKSHSDGTRSLSTEWNSCPLRYPAPRRGERRELPDFKLVRLQPPHFVQASVFSLLPIAHAFH